MRSRFVFVPDHHFAPKLGGLLYRVAGAIVFFLAGAVAATELYPQVIADRPSENRQASSSGQAAAPRPNSLSDTKGASLPAAYIGGPIPEPTFAPIQLSTENKAAQAPGDEVSSARDSAVRKSRAAKIKSARGESHRHNVNAYYRAHREELPSGAAGGSWNVWGRL